MPEAASANLYSLIETCKANHIDPYAYLVSLFRRLPTAQTADDFEALLPSLGYRQLTRRAITVSSTPPSMASSITRLLLSIGSLMVAC